MEDNVGSSEKSLAVIARSLAFLCVQQGKLQNADIGERAEFLETLGLTRGDIAGLLGSTEPSIAELLRVRRKKGKGGKRGKKAGRRKGKA